MTRNFWFRLMSYSVILLSGFFFISVLSKNVSSLPLVPINLTTVSFFILTVMLYVMISGINVTVWYILLRTTGEPVYYRNSLMIFSISNFAKYIPGNIANQVGRVALAKMYGMQVSRVVFSMILEAGWAITSSACLAATSLVSSTHQISTYLPSYLSIQNLIYIAVGAGITPIFIGYFLWHPPPFLSRFLDGNVKQPDLSSLTLCFFLNVIAFLLMGWIIDLIARNLFQMKDGDLMLMAAVFSIAWIAGFITPGAPAGLGVREVIVIGMLGPVYGVANSIGITIAFRLVTLAGDCIIFITGLVMRRLMPPVLVVQEP